MSETTPILELRGFQKYYYLKPNLWGQTTATVHALEPVDLTLAPGETLSIVGESGCGKSTLGKAVVRLHQPTAGEIWLGGVRVDKVRGAELKAFRSRIQIIFQDPFSSLNPRLTVHEMLAEPLHNFSKTKSGAQTDARIAELLDMVGLPKDAGGRYPHQFSGGQRQRIAIARALAPDPDVIVCDEAVSALDVSVKAQIVNLLGDIQKKTGMALLFISHDLAIVEHLTHHVAVMYLGEIVEKGSRKAIFGGAHHPYTKALISAVPVPDPVIRRARILLEGDVPSPLNPPPGCRFHTRCPFATQLCRTEAPSLRAIGPDHMTACHFDTFPERKTDHATT